MAEDVGIYASTDTEDEPHGMLYYDGYVYICRRDHAYGGAWLYKVNVDDYTDIRSEVMVFANNAGLTDMIRIGENIYISGHYAVVAKVHIPTFTVTLLPIGDIKGDAIRNDATYLYIAHWLNNGKITRMHLITGAYTTHDVAAGAYWHGMCIDGDYLYAHDVVQDRLYKINKNTMVSAGFVATGRCTDDVAQDDTYVYLGREFTTAGIVRVRKSDLDITVYTPGGIGFCYGIFNINDRIFYLDFNNDYIWEFNQALALIETWHVNPPYSLAGINEFVLDDDGHYHVTTYTTPGLIKIRLDVETFVETGRTQEILAKCGEIKALKTAVLALAINGSYVDVVSARISHRTINQGHSLFSAVLDNADGAYSGVGEFMARDAISIVFRTGETNYEIFKGILDSGKHILTQEDKWSLMDRVRLGGRDMSYLLSNFKYTKTWPSEQQVLYALHEAFAATGCGITISYEISPEIDGKTDIDKYLLDMVTDMFEVANMEGYVDVNKNLSFFLVASPPSIALTFDKTNVLSASPVEFDGLDIKNSIEVLGAQKLSEPELEDSWTDRNSLNLPIPGASGPKWEKLIGDTLWIQDSGTIDKCVKCSTVLINGVYRAHLRFTFPEPIRVGRYDQFDLLEFWQYTPTDLWPDNDYFRIYLHSPDGFFYTHINFPGYVWPLFSDKWMHISQPLGAKEVNRPGNTKGAWWPVGNPDWLNLTYMEFYGMWSNNAVDDAFIIDGLKFSPKRTHALTRNTTSISRYGKREHIVVADAATNEECKYMADSLAAKMGNPVSILQLVTPLDSFIIDGAWEGKVGHTVQVNLSPLAVGTYRIQDITVDIVPHTNLSNGHDAIATVNLVKESDAFHPDAYVSTARPQTASLLKRYITKAK